MLLANTLTVVESHNRVSLLQGPPPLFLACLALHPPVLRRCLPALLLLLLLLLLLVLLNSLPFIFSKCSKHTLEMNGRRSSRIYTDQQQQQQQQGAGSTADQQQRRGTSVPLLLRTCPQNPLVTSSHTCTSGLHAFMTAAMPPISPPPPTGTMTASTPVGS